MRHREPIEPRFWTKVYRAPSGCWEWLGYRNDKGYGYLSSMWTRPRNQKAHRVAYELLVGPIPDGLQIDHLCRNRGCVNPVHLQPVTPQTNQLRGQTTSRRYAERTLCARGHPLDGLKHKPNGTPYRYCKTCARERVRAASERKRSTALLTAGSG